MIDCLEEDPKAVFETLLSELITYNPDLSKKPKLTIRTKTDLLNDVSDKHWSKMDDYIDISSVTNKGVNELISSITEVLHEKD